jgi:hypothetical protein
MSPTGGADPGRRTTPFLRGLTIGALVGAAIAGSRIWLRFMRRTDRS